MLEGPDISGSIAHDLSLHYIEQQGFNFSLGSLLTIQRAVDLIHGSHRPTVPSMCASILLLWNHVHWSSKYHGSRLEDMAVRLLRRLRYSLMRRKAWRRRNNRSNILRHDVSKLEYTSHEYGMYGLDTLLHEFVSFRESSSCE